MSDVVVTRPRARTAALSRDWLWFVVLTLGVGGFYVALGAPVLDPPSYLDPWIYTASFVNFGFIYDVFGWTYYPSRLPWVIPGIVAHSLFSPVVAFFVLHAIYFFAAGLFAYLLFRRFFGPTAALAAYALLMLSPLFYDAYSNDYPDGALLTYLLGGAYFGLTAYGSRRPWLRAFWAGFFLAAAVGTNLFGGVAAACLLLAYVIVRIGGALRSPRALGVELGAGVAGAFLLLIVCGSFSMAYGGGFLFFMPQVRELQNINPADYKVGGLSWTLSEPQLLLPAFGVAVVAALLVPRLFARRALSDAERFAAGAAVAAAVFYALIVIWELGFTGNFLETPYYFSIFNVVIAFCFAAALWLLRIDGRGAVAVAAAAVVPTLLVFGASLLPRDRAGAVVVVALIGVVLLLVALRSRSAAFTGRWVTTATAAVLSFTAVYAVCAGRTTASVFVRHTFEQRRDVQDVAFQLIRFMKSRGIEQQPFQFWYDRSADVALDGIQSVYLWGDTWVGLDLPRIDRPMRRLLEQRKPNVLVLLCKQPGCHGGARALARGGYPNRPYASGVLAAGDERVYVRALLLPRFVRANRPVNPTIQGYRRGASPFAARPRGTAVTDASFADGIPAGWSGDAADAAGSAAGRPFSTSEQPWAYELTGPEIELPPGRYAVYARGRVLAGGLDLGVLDADASSWIQQRTYWYGQRAGFARGWMMTPFALSDRTKVRVILSNWVPKSQASRWQLEEIRVVRSP